MLGMAPRERGLREPKYIYSGATGAFLVPKPGLGTAPSTGGAVSDLIGPLHFGGFAGVASKAVWFSSDSVVRTSRSPECCCGLSGARKCRCGAGSVGQRSGSAMGCPPRSWPSRLVTSSLAPPAATYDWMLAAFLLSVGLAALITLMARDPRRLLLNATGVMLLTLPLVRWISGGPSWPELASRTRNGDRNRCCRSDRRWLSRYGRLSRDENAGVAGAGIAHERSCGVAPMHILLALLAIAVSVALLGWIGVRDPKRVHSQDGEAAIHRPLTTRQRRLLGLVAAMPGFYRRC